MTETASIYPRTCTLTSDQLEALRLLEHLRGASPATVGEWVYGDRRRAMGQPKGGHYELPGGNLLRSIQALELASKHPMANTWSLTTSARSLLDNLAGIEPVMDPREEVTVTWDENDIHTLSIDVASDVGAPKS